MEEKTIGILAAPDFPTANAEAMKSELTQSLSEVVDQQIKWYAAIQVSSLIGVAERVGNIMDEAKRLKRENNWDFVVCLTDLPVFSKKRVVMADASFADGIVHISLPAFGILPTSKRTRRTVTHMVREMYTQQMNGSSPNKRQDRRRSLDTKANNGFFKKLNQAFRFSPLRRISSPDDVGGVDTRFVITSKWKGWSQVLLGMSVANRPWTIMPSFKNVVALAFASGAYGLIFPTLWQLSLSLNSPRLVSLMVASIVAMIVWIVVAHNLWEKRNKNATSRLRLFYNAATVMTLMLSILMYYLILFVMFLFAVLVFVPPDMFNAQTDQSVGLGDYITLAWLVTSVATVAGAIGSGLEKTEEVGKITYGYRQYLRYEQVKRNEKKEEEEKYGTSTNSE